VRHASQDAAAEAGIREEFQRWFFESRRKDTAGCMTHFAADALSYEHVAPLQYQGVEAIRKVCQAGFDVFQGSIDYQIRGLAIAASGELGFAYGLNHVTGETPDGRTLETFTRGTWCWRKIDGKWRVAHQHLSAPFDAKTGKAALLLKP
jgi:ketosteroid isomerase-like protein